jgi:hypothetical protein
MPIITLETIKEYLPKYKPMGLPEESDANKAKRVQRRITKLRKNAGLFADDDEVVFHGNEALTLNSIDEDYIKYAERINKMNLEMFYRALLYRQRLEQIIGVEVVKAWHEYFLKTYPQSPANYADCLFTQLIRNGVTGNEIDAIRDEARENIVFT